MAPGPDVSAMLGNHSAFNCNGLGTPRERKRQIKIVTVGANFEEIFFGRGGGFSLPHCCIFMTAAGSPMNHDRV